MSKVSAHTVWAACLAIKLDLPSFLEYYYELWFTVVSAIPAIPAIPATTLAVTAATLTTSTTVSTRVWFLLASVVYQTKLKGKNDEKEQSVCRIAYRNVHWVDHCCWGTSLLCSSTTIA
jgi:hypothetical protein